MKNLLDQMRLHHKLMLSMLLLGLFPVMVISAVSVFYGKNVLEKNITEELQLIANDKSQDIAKTFQDNLREIQLLAKHPQIINLLKQANLRQTKDTDKLLKSILRTDEQWIKHKGNSRQARIIANNTLSAFLKNYQNREPDRYGEIFVTDKYGAAIAMTAVLSDYYQADEQWWRGAYNDGKGSVFIDDRGYDESADAIVVGVVVPVRDGTSVIGVLKINFKVNKVLATSGRLASDQYGHAIIARHDGFVLFSTNNTAHQQGALFEEHHMAVQYGVIENREHGKSIIAAHAIVPSPYPVMARLVSTEGVISEQWSPTKWHVVLHIDKDTAFLPIKRLYYWSLLVGTLVILMVWLTGMRLSRILSAPLEKLHNGMVQVASGDLGHRVTSEVRGEIGELAKTFDYMATQLQDTLTSQNNLQMEIFQRKFIEEKLRDSEQRFRGTFEQAAVGIAHVGLDGSWLRVNQRLCDITGYSKQELLQKTFQDITHPDDLENDLAQVQALLDGKANDYSMEKRYLRKDGRIIWINLTVALAHNADGNPDYFISVIEDINEKRQMKEGLYKLNKELEQRVEERTRELYNSNQALESTLSKLYQAEEQMLQAEKMAAMGTFVAGITHELNNPLTGVLNYVQYARDKIDDKKLKGYLDKAEQNTLRAAKVIENMLAYSRQSQVEEKDINIVTTIEHAVDIMRPELKQEHIDIELDLDPALPPVTANADTLEQVFINLMGNARDAMEGAADKRLSIRALNKAHTTQVSIQDTGKGIAEHLGGKVFDPFFSTKPPGKGTGLGLSVCQRIISNLGGTLRYDSKEGQGTTFYIQLPTEN